MSSAILVEIHNSGNELPRTRNCGGCPSPFHGNHDALNVGQNGIAWEPCRRASNQAAWIRSYRAPGRRSAFGWSILGEGLDSPDAGVRGAFPGWLWQGSYAKHDLVVCHLQEWTPSFFSANIGSEHFKTASPTESLHWYFMKYFSSCLREWTTIDKHMEFSQDIDISNSISS